MAAATVHQRRCRQRDFTAPEFVRSQFTDRLRGYASLAGTLVACAAAVALLGALAHIATLATFGFATAPMWWGTALCLLLLAGALLFAQRSQRPRWRNLGAFAALLLAIGGTTLGPMPGATGLSLAFLAGALLFLRPRLFAVAQTLVAIVAMAACIVLLSFLFDYPLAYFATEAIGTFALELLLASGIIAARAAHGWVAELASDTPSAAMGRRLTLLTFALLPMVGWLCLQGEQLGWYDTQIGVAIMVSASMTVLGTLIWTLTRAANRAEERIKQLDRLYRTVSSINKLIVRCRDSEELLREASRIAREEGGFRMAYISMTGEGESDPIVPVDKPMIVNDIRGDSHLEGWRAHAKARGLRSIAALPIKVDRVLAGVFVFGATRREFFVGEELALLHELSDDVGFALMQMNVDARRRSAEAALQELNLRLEEQVSARTAQLQASNAELEAFCYTVSHDLRAPLRTIDGYSQLVVDDYGPKLDEMGKHLLQMVRNGARRMAQLVDDLLAFSRLGRQALVTSNVDVARMVDEVWSELTRDIPERSIDFSVGTLPDAEADPALLRQVWDNLLANAIKYTGKRERAVIEVDGKVQGDEVVFHVCDNGVGFDMKFANKLMQVFQRLHAEADFPGTGIGLATVERIVARHGGRVWFEAKIDDGANFWFSLPRPPR